MCGQGATGGSAASAVLGHEPWIGFHTILFLFNGHDPEKVMWVVPFGATFVRNSRVCVCSSCFRGGQTYICRPHGERSGTTHTTTPTVACPPSPAASQSRLPKQKLSASRPGPACRPGPAWLPASGSRPSLVSGLSLRPWCSPGPSLLRLNNVPLRGGTTVGLSVSASMTLLATVSDTAVNAPSPSCVGSIFNFFLIRTLVLLC